MIFSPYGGIKSTNGEKFNLNIDFLDDPYHGILSHDCEAINDNSVIAGMGTSGPSYAFKWKNGITQLLEIPETHKNSWSKDINELEDIIGGIQYENKAVEACMWDSSGNFNALGDLGRGWSIANGLNDLKQGVGMAFADGKYHAVLYEGGEVINLNDFLPAKSEWRILEEAFDINNKGQIIGYGFFDENNNPQGFLMNPIIPEPFTLGLLGLGAGMLVRRKGRVRKGGG